MPWVDDGRTILLWQDVCNNFSLKLSFPSLFSFARRQSCSMQDFLGNMSLEDNFHTPLSPQATQEYHLFCGIFDQMQATRAGKDI
jgi:hypothetical protein